MKKNFFRFAALLMAGSLLAFSCEDKPTPDDPNNPGGKEEPEVTGPSVKVVIDGDFSDWDAITADVAGTDDYLAVLKETAPEAIPIIKTSSDALNVYFYVELFVDALPQNSICSEWGDSYNGTPEKGYSGDGTAEQDKNFHHNPPLNIFIDPDGKESTGFYTYQDGDDAAIPGLGCEMCAQQICFYNFEKKKFCIAWNQVNIGPETLDGAPYDYNGTFFQEDDWNLDTAVPQWGWQNYDNSGTGDNIAPRPENIKSVVVNETTVRMEFAIEKSEIVNLPDDATEYAWGICYRWSDCKQDIGPIRAKYSK
ncbi:MAG: hypothetical protein IKZ91_00175 [Bacteroidales bacterium]|nr:hypothetical protein [Bacteroidales bacterium]